MSQQNLVFVETEYGPVKGTQKSSALGLDYLSFQGIPYMKAPIGKLRFRDAQPPEVWTEPLDATREPSAYVQFDFFRNEDIGSENASIINVYTRDVKGKKPVMVWIHGGGFVGGSSRTDFYGPDYILQKDVIVVSFNYRLGVFGFLSLLDPKAGIPGNAGLKDQVFALKWIQRNIEQFGGDPNNITIFGESAGGGSVHFLMISEAAKGLFHKAIPMSGVAFNKPWACIPNRNWAARLAKELGWNGCGDDTAILEFLEEQDAFAFNKHLMTLATDVESLGEHILGAFQPCIEPYITETCIVPKEPVLIARDAWSNSIPCMIGGTSFEGLLRANYLQENVVNVMQNINYFAPLTELGLNVNSEKAAKYGKIIKEVYYGLLRPSKSNQEPYLHVMIFNYRHYLVEF
jgi:carboxylesterase type B